MSDKFTVLAQKVLLLARQEAEIHQHNVIGTEHLLLGILKLGDGFAVGILKDLGIDLQDLENEIRLVMINRRRVSDASSPDYSPNAREVLEVSAPVVAKNFKNDLIGTAHLLSAITEHEACTGSKILRKFAIDGAEVGCSHYELYGLGINEC